MTEFNGIFDSSWCIIFLISMLIKGENVGENCDQHAFICVCE